MLKRYSSLLATLLITCTTLWGQGVTPTVGKEFWLGFMQNYDGGVTLKLYISGRVNTTGTASSPNGGWSQAFTVTANSVTELTVPTSFMHSGSEVMENKAIVVLTADTVSVFALNYETATADAAVVYPINSLGTTYRTHCYVGLDGFGTLNSEFLVVATRNDTQVEITPACNTLGGQLAGVPFTVDLDSGQSYQVQALLGSQDLTGTRITGTEQSGSCRPFAVFSGSVCPDIPVGCFACDHVFDENLPTVAWGTKYYTVPWANTTSYTYRILGHSTGTSVQVNGGAPINLNGGQYVEFNSVNTPLCIEGNQPFSVAQYMEGNSCAGNSDPALLILNSEEAKITDVTFATVVSANITDQYANVIVSTASVGDVVLDGVSVPPSSFNAFPLCGTQSYAQLPLTQGSHRLACPTGITIYVYGTGPNYETYAYSAGSFIPIPGIQVDTVLCGVDSTGQLTLAPPNPINNPYWTTVSNPDDTLYEGLGYTFTPITSDIYVVTGNEFLSACAQSYYFSVEVATPPQLTVTASSPQVCAHTPVQLNVVADPPGTYLYNWWPDPELNDGSLSDPVAIPTHPTWFYVSVATLNNCAVAVDSIFVDVLPGDVLVQQASATDDAICLGDTTQLLLDVQQIIAQDSVGATIATWWSSLQNGMVSTNCGSITGNAIWFDGANPRSITSNGLDVSQGGSVQFAIKMGTGVAPCDEVDPGEDVVLEYSINGGGSWNTMFTCWEYLYPTFTTLNIPIPLAAQTTSTQFRWRQLNSTAAGQDNWSLDNVAIAVHDATGLTFAWTPAASIVNSTVEDPFAFPAAPTWYYITTTDQVSSCTYQDSIFINVGAPFTLTMTNDTTICDIAGIQLHATPSAGTDHTWAWTPGTDLSAVFVENPIATPNATIEYHVTVVSAEGCDRTDSVTITVGQLLDLTVTTTDDDLCQGESTSINASVGFAPNISFAWTPSNTVLDAADPSTTASPVSPTWYVMTAIDTISGCMLTDSVHINVNTLYNVYAGNDTTVCSINGLVLNVSHNVPNPIYSWTPANYLTGENTATPTVTHDSTATYIVQVSDNLGCSDRDTIVVTVAFDALVFIADSSLCAGDSMLIDAGFPDADHAWSTGATSQSIWVDAEDDYTVTMTDDNGCQSTFTTSVTVDPLPALALGPDTSLCIGQQWTLNAGNPGSDFLWSTAETTGSITVTTNADYSVRVIDANDCVNRDTIRVTFDPLPVIDLRDTTVCVSETITLDAGNPGSSYLWSTGATTQTIDVNAATDTYSVIVTTATVCVDSADAHLEFISFPIVDLGPDHVLCDTDSLPLDAGNPGQSFFWSTGQSTQNILVLDDATVWVDVFNGYCTTRDSLVAIFNPQPLPLAYDSLTLCFNYPPYKTLVDAGNAGCTFVWNTQETTQSIVVDQYGWYVVDITTPLNCTITDSVNVIEYCPSELFVPNAFTPDGDGANDLFFIQGNNLGASELTIFDRWGEVVYSGMNGSAAWNGIYNGTAAKEGVYVWKLKYRFKDDVFGTLGTEKEALGHVTLMR